ncbi:MAG: YdbH domain-containing protein, partial [Pseudomonadota bacterium]
GRIKYGADEAAQALASSSTDLSLALDLLKDFNYKVLSSDVTLDESGTLSLALSLAGSNPNIYNGRQVNFNINVEQNLGPLLQSLRLSDNLVRGIEDRLR